MANNTDRRLDPFRNFRYRLVIDQLEEAGFSEVTIGDLSTDPIEYREGDEKTTVRKIKGLNKYGNITLKWGMTNSKVLADWHQDVVDDKKFTQQARKTVYIHVLSEAGEIAATFEIIYAWPHKYDPSDLNAKGNEVAIDLLELCNEGIKRIL
jgi:phage tail-like protein